VASRALSAVRALPASMVTGANRLGRRVIDEDVLPLWSADLPGGGAPRQPRHRLGRTVPPVPATTLPGSARGAAPFEGAVQRPVERPVHEVVYFTACVGAMFGPSQAGPGVRDAFTRLCARAEVELRTPADLPSLCCGTPWRSKGMTKGAREMEARVLESLWIATREGELPVVCDASSCTEGLLHTVQVQAATPGSRYAALRVVDAVSFVAEHVLPRLPEARKIQSLALHPTCSTARMGINEDLFTVASAVAQQVTVPPSWGCCGFAGDRGLLHPELSAAATAEQAAELAGGDFDAYASSNRTCELGMSRATGAQYEHILELLDAATA
ncbi:MAG: (Fe-S)-binding protein, partial [Candidatus Nanopelagicales bacterium]